MVDTAGITFYITPDDLCTVAGITRTQLYYWIEQGWITPEGERGRYTEGDVATVSAFAALMRRSKGELAAALLKPREGGGDAG